MRTLGAGSAPASESLSVITADATEAELGAALDSINRTPEPTPEEPTPTPETATAGPQWLLLLIGAAVVATELME